MVRVSSPAKLRPWSELTAKMVMGGSWVGNVGCLKDKMAIQMEKMAVSHSVNGHFNRKIARPSSKLLDRGSFSTPDQHIIQNRCRGIERVIPVRFGSATVFLHRMVRAATVFGSNACCGERGFSEEGHEFPFGPPLESASPSPPQGSIRHRNRVKSGNRC